MARSAADLDRYLAHVVALRRRAPDHRFHQILTRRIDVLLDERHAATGAETFRPGVNAPGLSGPADETPEPKAHP